MCKAIFYRLACWHDTKRHIKPCRKLYSYVNRNGERKPCCKATTEPENRIYINLSFACRVCETSAWNECIGWNEKFHRSNEFLGDLKRGGASKEVITGIEECVGRLTTEHADAEWAAQQRFPPILSRNGGEVLKEERPDEEWERKAEEEATRRFHEEVTNYNFAWWIEESAGEGSANRDLKDNAAQQVQLEEEENEHPEYDSSFFTDGWGSEFDDWTVNSGDEDGGPYAALTLEDAVKWFWEEISSVDMDIYLEESCALRSIF